MLVLRVGKNRKKFKIIDTATSNKKGFLDRTQWLSKSEMQDWIRLNTSSQVEQNLVRKLK